MKTTFVSLLLLLALLAGLACASRRQNVTVIAYTSEAADGLDLYAVAELFKEAENLEEFEYLLNDPEIGVNNLDLNDNGEVDFIRVVEEISGDTHIIILQAALGNDEFQDVATIEVERTGDDEYALQMHGCDVIYGVDYYVIPPAHVHLHTWPTIIWIYRPHYHPYRSAFYWGHYPRWWRPYDPVTVNVYRTRTVKYARKTKFKVRKTSRVRTVTKVKYRQRNSGLVKKKMVTRKSGKKAVKKTTKTKKEKKTKLKKRGTKQKTRSKATKKEK